MADNTMQNIRKGNFVMSQRRSRRILREVKTFEVMIGLYCSYHHGEKLCPSCTEVLRYSKQRILKCPFEETKPACSKCTIHCFKESYKLQVRKIMSFSGPKMAFSHPYLAFFHICDKLRRTINRKRGSRKGSAINQ